MSCLHRVYQLLIESLTNIFSDDWQRTRITYLVAMILDALLTSSCQRLLATIIDFCKDSYYTDSVFINKNSLFTIAHNAIVYFALYKTFPTSFTRVWCPGKWASELDLEAIYCDGYQSFDRILISIYPYLLFLSDILNYLTKGRQNFNLLSHPNTH